MNVIANRAPIPLGLRHHRGVKGNESGSKGKKPNNK